MKRIFLLDRQSFFLNSTLLFVFILPLSQFLNVRLLVVLMLMSFFVRTTKFNIRNLFIQASDIVLFLIVLLIGLIYTDDLAVGFKVLETSFSFLMVPIVIFKLSPLNKEKLHMIFLSFILGVAFACAICLGYSIFRFTQSGSLSVFFFGDFTDIINSQPTYLAYYLCFSIIVGIYFLYYEKLKIHIGVITLFLTLFFAALMLTGERTAFVSMLFVFSFFILKFLFEEDRSFVKKLAFSISIFFLVAMLVINRYNVSASSVKVEGDYWERLSLWKSAIHANSNFFFGVGTGDYKTVMNEYYRTHNLSQFASDSFNAHNQFLQTFFSNGLLGLLAVVILVARPLYLSVKYQNVLGILTFFSFIIYGMTEVFLGRYQGVIFFSLLHQVFIHSYYSRQSSFSLKEI